MSVFCVSVPEPQLDTFVVCRSKEYLTGIQLEDGPVDDRQFHSNTLLVYSSHCKINLLSCGL